MSHSQPRFRCLAGTFSPSRRQIRSTRLWFTRQRQQGRDPTVAIPPVFAGQRNDVDGQSRLVVCHPGRVSLGASHLSRHTARPTLGNGQHLADVPDWLYHFSVGCALHTDLDREDMPILDRI